MTKGYDSIDQETVDWLLLNLRAGRATVFRLSRGKVSCRATAGSERQGQAEVLKLAQKVIGTGRSELLSRIACVPIYGINRNVVGALVLDLPFDGEAFTDFEFRFCQRCARWNEISRMGGSRPPRPCPKGGESHEVYDMNSTMEVRISVSTGTSGNRFERGTIQRPSVFFRSLHTMMYAGLPLNESIYFLAASSQDTPSKRILTRLGDRVTEGAPLSVAMSDFPESFGRYLVGLVRVGEETGALSQVLLTLSEYLENSSKLERKLRSALLYPAVITAAAFSLLFLGPPYLLEGQMALFERSKEELPLLTRLFMNWAGLCRSGLSAQVMVIGAVGLGFALRTRKFRDKIIGFLASRAPFQRLMLLLSSARFARCMSLSIRSGQSMTEALSWASAASGDPRLFRMTKEAAGWVFEGETLAESLGRLRYFPKGYCEVLVAGEEAGRTEVMFDLLSEMYEMEIDLSVNALTSLVEPLLLLLVGVIAALVLVATMQPTVALLQAL